MDVNGDRIVVDIEKDLDLILGLCFYHINIQQKSIVKFIHIDEETLKTLIFQHFFMLLHNEVSNFQLLTVKCLFCIIGVVLLSTVGRLFSNLGVQAQFT